MAAVRTIAAEELVLDGEVLALRPDGRPEAFQLVASRREHRDSPRAGARMTLRVFFFDVLHVDGRNLLDVALTERAAELERLLPPELMVERDAVTTPRSSTEVFDSAVARGSRAWW